jgi:hypothetical protein
MAVAIRNALIPQSRLFENRHSMAVFRSGGCDTIAA